MTSLRLPSWLTFTTAIGILSVCLPAQTNCNEGAGPLRQDQLQGIGVSDIIKKFSAHESEFKEAQTHYSYTMEVSVQTLAGQDVDGEFRRLSEISYLQGRRMERVIFAPQSTLRRISLSKQDFDDLDRPPFILTPENLPQYNLLYVGEQKVDMMETYVFEVAPKVLEKGKRYYQGKVWVETRDFAVVKSCGKTVPDEDPEAVKKRVKKKRRMPGDENVSPTLVTYRQEFEHKYWFPVYVRSDDLLHFSYGDDIHLREVIKYTKYNRTDTGPSTVSATQP